MALSSYSALSWSAVCDYGFVPSPPAAAEPPQQLQIASAAFPGCSNFGATYSIVNSNRHLDVMKADPLFFNKAYCNYGGIGNAVLPGDDYGYFNSSYPDYANCYSDGKVTLAELLDPVPDYLSCPVNDPLSLPGFCDINYDHLIQQQIPSGPGLLGFSDYSGLDVGAEQFCYDQMPAHQPPKRHRPCYCDAPDDLLNDDPCPPAQLPGVHAINVISSNKVEEDVIVQPRPRQRRVSTQSLAARERRKKITDKTQELGKLIPGGSKMNTAEMLQSAYDYVKFLQSQVQILQLMSPSDTSQENDPVEKPEMEANDNEKGTPLSPNLLQMVASPVIQEKLYKEASCIIPRSLAENLVNSHPHLQDLHQLL